MTTRARSRPSVEDCRSRRWKITPLRPTLLASGDDLNLNSNLLIGSADRDRDVDIINNSGNSILISIKDAEGRRNIDGQRLLLLLLREFVLDCHRLRHRRKLRLATLA